MKAACPAKRLGSPGCARDVNSPCLLREESSLSAALRPSTVCSPGCPAGIAPAQRGPRMRAWAATVTRTPAASQRERRKIPRWRLKQFRLLKKKKKKESRLCQASLFWTCLDLAPTGRSFLPSIPVMASAAGVCFSHRFAGWKRCLPSHLSSSSPLLGLPWRQSFLCVIQAYPAPYPTCDP